MLTLVALESVSTCSRIGNVTQNSTHSTKTPPPKDAPSPFYSLCIEHHTHQPHTPTTPSTEKQRIHPLNPAPLLTTPDSTTPTTRVRILPLGISNLTAIPLGTSNRANTQHVHRVYFLQRAVLALDDEKEDDEDEGRTAAGEDEAVPVVYRARDEGCEEGDEEVPVFRGAGG